MPSYYIVNNNRPILA